MVKIFIIVLIFFVNYIIAKCPDNVAIDLNPSKREEIVTLENSCLCSLVIKQKNKEKSIQNLDNISKYNRMSDTLLFCLWYKLRALKNNELATYAVNLWKKRYNSISSILSYYRERNELGKFDTICKIFDTETILDEVELLKWLEVKLLLKDHSKISDMVCRIITSKTNLTYTAIEKLEMITNEIEDSLLLDKILQDLIKCSKDYIDVRTRNELKWWIIDKYGRKKLYLRQIEAMMVLENDVKIRDGAILNIAIEHLKEKRFTLARDISLRLVKMTKDSSIINKAIEIVFKSYLYTNNIDSAKKWLEKTVVQSEENMIEAIQLYQKSGEYNIASSLILSLPSSLAKDTLYIKNLILMDSLERAQLFISQKNTFIARHQFLYLLWKIRINLFSGRIEKCMSLFDSISGESSQISDDLLQYKYWLLLLSQNQEEIELFRQIEYTLFRGEIQNTVELFCKKELNSENRWKLGVYIAKKQLVLSNGKEAVKTLLCAPANDEAEYLYTLAEAYIISGSKEEGKKILEKLILNFSNIYSVKARQLLSDID